MNYPFPCTCIFTLLALAPPPFPGWIFTSRKPLRDTSYHWLTNNCMVFFSFSLKRIRYYFLSIYNTNIRSSGKAVYLQLVSYSFTSWLIKYSEPMVTFKPIRLLIVKRFYLFVLQYYFLNVHWFTAYIILYSLMSTRGDLNLPEM